MTKAPQEKSQPAVYTDPRLMTSGEWMLEESMIPTDKKDMPFPMYRTRQVAEIFFGRKSSWFYFTMEPHKFAGRDEDGKEIRKRTGDTWLRLDGEPLGIRRDKLNQRYYSLADVERIVHALAQNRRIDGATMQRALLIVKTIAQQHGILS